MQTLPASSAARVAGRVERLAPRCPLPAILKWALEGLVQLNARRRLIEPESSRQAVAELADLVSPIGAFLREVCVESAEQSVPRPELYRHYVAWCGENGRGAASLQKFGADLRSVRPGLAEYRPKVPGQARERHYRGIGVDAEWAAAHPRSPFGYRSGVFGGVS